MSVSSRSAAFSPSGERTRIRRDFPLSDRALLVVMHEFDWFLDRYNVFRKVSIDVVDQRSLRGGLAGAGGTSHKHQSSA